MPVSRAPIRWRFFATGAGAVVVALLAGGLIDRALTLAEVAPQLRFATSTVAVIALLVGPLLYSLEGWVIQPLEALEHLHDKEARADRHALRRHELPKEVADVIRRHTELLYELEASNRVLQTRVMRRTEALEVIVSAADILTRSEPGLDLTRALLPLIARLDVGSAAAIVQREDDRWVLVVQPPGPVHAEDRASLEARMLHLISREETMRVVWLPPTEAGAEPVRRLRLLARQPLDPEQDPEHPAALVLFTVRPAGISPVAEDLRRVLSTLGGWMAHLRPSMMGDQLAG